MIIINTEGLRNLNRKLKKIGQEFAKSARKPKEINDILYKNGNEMRNYIIMRMQTTPKDPLKSIRKTKSGKRHSPSLPGEYPAIDTGAGIRSVTFDTTVNSNGAKLELGVNAGAPYLAILEKGKGEGNKGFQFKRPWLDPTVKKFTPKIIDELEKVVPDNVVNFMIEGMK